MAQPPTRFGFGQTRGFVTRRGNAYAALGRDTLRLIHHGRKDNRPSEKRKKRFSDGLFDNAGKITASKPM